MRTAQLAEPAAGPTDTDTTQADERAGGVVDQLNMAMAKLGRLHGCVSAQLSKEGFDKTSFVLLGTLAQRGPQRSSALAEAVFADPSTISRQVAQLVRNGLVERTADPEDGRAAVLAITNSGLALLERARDRRNAALARVLSSWSDTDLGEFAALFDRFTRDFEQALPMFIAECAEGTRS
ncbi:MarR family winged helix-turn-helix transcriptional regulator [Goodfellowiella coeruleoviolacea]|uniref:MarR family winged helix-turn-helix transcriptional regulator n=1 Tax=Goodfellowiella coeruleoviolacea TaxID=334858 RepID=UPI000AB049CF|nr:MarR family transcriptional regulator [Goodfellowiella coeruleoviolacea]